MHRFQTESVIFRLRIAALLLFFKWLLIPATLVVLLYSILVAERELTIIALWLGALVVAVAILQRLLANRARCPLCMTPVLSINGCSKHRKASRFLGSYRLRVAQGVLFKGAFLCPYCHEATEMKVRFRRR
jgi:hypothetical protein